VTTAGGVQCWGSNLNGQLGDSSVQSAFVPIPVPGLSSGVAAIAAGTNYACALTTAGSVLCWGDNDTGELGDNSTTSSSVPVAVAVP